MEVALTPMRSLSFQVVSLARVSAVWAMVEVMRAAMGLSSVRWLSDSHAAKRRMNNAGAARLLRIELVFIIVTVFESC